MSPTIHREGNLRFFFYSNEGTEPPHVHVEGQSGSAKVWIGAGEVANHTGIRPADLAKIVAIVREHREQFLEAWHEHFGTTD